MSGGQEDQAVEILPHEAEGSRAGSTGVQSVGNGVPLRVPLKGAIRVPLKGPIRVPLRVPSKGPIRVLYGVLRHLSPCLVLSREWGKTIIGGYIGTTIGIHSPIPC